MNIDISLFDFRLALLYEYRQLIVQLVDQVQHIQVLGRVRLVRPQLECLFELTHSCLEVIQLSINYSLNLMHFRHFVGVVPILLLSQLKSFLKNLKGTQVLALQFVQDAYVVVAVARKLSPDVGRLLKALDGLLEIAFFCVVAADEEVAVGGFVGIRAKEDHDYFGVENIVVNAIDAYGVAEIADTGNNVKLLLQMFVVLLSERFFLAVARDILQLLDQVDLFLQIVLQLLLGTLFVVQQKISLSQKTHSTPVVQLIAPRFIHLQPLTLETHQHFSVQQTLRELLVTKILIEALPHLEYFLEDIVGGWLTNLAITFVFFFPVLELMVPAAIENFFAGTALKEGLFGTDLAGGHLRRVEYLLLHALQPNSITIITP